MLLGNGAESAKVLTAARDTCSRSFEEYALAVAELGRLQAASQPAAAAAPAGAAPVPAKPAAAVDQAVELEFWKSVKDSGNPAMLRAYLDKFPDGSFAPLARIRIKELAEGARP